MTSEFADHASGIVRWRDASEGLASGAMFYVMERPGVVGEAEITLISKEYQ